MWSLTLREDHLFGVFEEKVDGDLCDRRVVRIAIHVEA
jgi:hypothetical protein